MNLKNNLWWNNQIIVTTLSKFRVSSYLMYFRIHTNHKYHNSLNDLINFNDFSDNLKNWESSFFLKISQLLIKNTLFLIGKRRCFYRKMGFSIRKWGFSSTLFLTDNDYRNFNHCNPLKKGKKKSKNKGKNSGFHCRLKPIISTMEKSHFSSILSQFWDLKLSSKLITIKFYGICK